MSPEFLEGGHFWIQEYVTGAVLVFRMESSGLLVFGDERSAFDGAVPPQYALAVKYLRRYFDRDRLREGTTDPTQYVFFGVVPLDLGLDYDWSMIPPVLGADIWDETAGEFVTEDVCERVFADLRVPVIPMFEKEVPARRISPRTYVIPDSHWTSEPAAGVVFRKKHGRRAVLLREEGRTDGETSAVDRESDTSLESVLESVVTDSTIDRVAAMEDLSPDRVDVEELATWVEATVAREHYQRLRDDLERRPEAFAELIEDRVRALVAGRWTEP